MSKKYQNKRLDKLNTPTAGMKYTMISIVIIVLVSVLAFVTYSKINKAQVEKQDNRQYIETLYNRVYNKESDLLETFSQYGDAKAYASYNIDENLKSNYLQVGDLFLRSTFSSTNDNLFRNDLFDADRLSIWLEFDTIQSEKYKAVLKNDQIKAKAYEKQLDELISKYTFLGN